MRELRQQLTNALLMIVTVAAVVAAAINFQQQSKYHMPDDGVTWVDQMATDRAVPDETVPVATYIAPGSPAEKAGIHQGDALISIDGLKISRAEEAAEVLWRLGSWHKAEYKIVHGGKEVPAPVIIGEVTRDSTLYYQYAVGVLYLGIGLFVYFRRGSAPRALHFFLLCLASFILSTFHYTGKLNNFDKVIYLGNMAAWFLAPTLFLHFCCCFPDRQSWIRHRGAAVLLYLPGLALLAVQAGFIFGWLRTAAPLIEMRWLLDRVWLGFLCAMYLAGGAVLAFQMRHASDPHRSPTAYMASERSVVRHHSFRADLRCAVHVRCCAEPSHEPGGSVAASDSSDLGIRDSALQADGRGRHLPARVRLYGHGYLLRSCDLLRHDLSRSVELDAGELNGAAMVAMILIAAFVLFQPIRKWVQEQLDRYFYKDRYDYRRTRADRSFCA